VHPSTIRETKPLKILIWTTPVILYLFLVVNGWLGANFGFHWDEHIFAGYVDDFHLHWRVIPTNYLYPSFCFWLILFADGLFHLVHPALANVPSLASSTDFSVFSRCVFVCVASLTVVWVYVLTLKITKKYWFALLAGLMFCSSFEFSYHSRWAVSDAIAVQFAILSTVMLFLDMSLTKRIVWSAAVAGIAAGTKYTAGIVCLNIIICMAASLQPWKGGEAMKLFLRRLFLMGAVFAVVFFITTPGCVYHMKTFLSGLQAQRRIYGGGHMLWDTMNPGLEHFSKICAYYVLALFSRLPAASIFISVLCIAGVVAALLKKEWNIFGLFLVMAVYVAYVSLFKVMIVRNLLYVLPFFVVLAAYGLFALHEKFKNKPGIMVVDAVLLCLVAISLHDVTKASWSIYRKDSIDMKKDLALYLAENPKDEYVFSPAVRQLLAGTNAPDDAPANPDALLIFVNREVKLEDFPKIAFNRYKLIAGPEDVNFDYYPDWAGGDRIVALKLKNASREMLEDMGMALH
jgi:hypothetical protein